MWSSTKTKILTLKEYRDYAKEHGMKLWNVFENVLIKYLKSRRLNAK